MSNSQLQKINKRLGINRYKVWFKQADYDLKAAQISHEANFCEWTCFQSEQAVEKALKAVLAHAGWHPPKTHKLSVLIGLCNNANTSFRNTQFKFRDLEVFTFVSRYPFVIPGDIRTPHEIVSCKDGESCLVQADFLLQRISEILNQEYQNGYEDIENIGSINIEKRLENIKKSVVEKFNPKKIVVFGSYGRGENYLSTIDLLIVAKTDLNYIERVREIREITKGGLPSVDPVVYTPEEFELLKQTDSFLQSALSEGRVIYEKK